MGKNTFRENRQTCDRYDIDHPRNWHHNLVSFPNFEAELNGYESSEPCDIDECGCSKIQCFSYRSRGDRPTRLRYLRSTDRWSSKEGRWWFGDMNYWYRQAHEDHIWGVYQGGYDRQLWRYRWDRETGRVWFLPGLYRSNDKKRTIYRNRDRRRKYDYRNESADLGYFYPKIFSL